LISKVFLRECSQLCIDGMDKLVLITISMILTTNGMAQKGVSVAWRIDTIWRGDNQKKDFQGIAGPIAGAHNGVVILGGGSNFPEAMPWENGKKKYYADINVYSLKGLDYIETFQLLFSTAYGANCSTPMGIVYAGGENEIGLSDRVLLIQWDRNSKEPIIKNLAPLPQEVTNASIVFYDHSVYFVGGETKNGTSADFLSLDLNDPSAKWKQLPSPPISVSHGVALIQSSKDGANILLVGGRSKNANGISSIYSSVYRYDLKEKKWREKKSLPYPLCAGTGIVADNNYLMMFGGDTGATFTQVETLMVAIQNEGDEGKRQKLIAKKNETQSGHPGFNREILMYDISLDSWTVQGSIPFDTPVTTTAIKTKNKVIIPSGEIKAGVRTPRFLIGKLSSN
jgi:N-acetylneuraminate epimerase